MGEEKPSRRGNDKLPQEVREYIDAAAERGAEKAMERLYAEIGKAGIRKTLLLLGAILAGLISWLGFSPHIPK